MSPLIDPAIVRALSLDPSTTKLASHGGSGFASTFRITTTTNSPKTFFIKTSPSPDAATMFEGEHASLNAIHAAVPTLCPQSFAWGRLDEPSSTPSYFLATEFLDLRSSSSSRRRSRKTPSSCSLSLAQKLAKLHTTPAPNPEGSDSFSSPPQFGFPIPTCCGDTPQPNPFTPSWPDFFAQHRLRFILERGERRNGPDPELHSLAEKTASAVVPRLLGRGHLGGSAGIVPVVVHGDLWSGNHGVGRFLGREEDRADGAGVGVEEEEEVIYDPSSCYAHSEYELGIMRMFGGFNADFMREYHELVPKTEPVEEYADRVKLYEVYHHLNHWAIFSGGYRDGAVGILRGLLGKYGGGDG